MIIRQLVYIKLIGVPFNQLVNQLVIKPSWAKVFNRSKIEKMNIDKTQECNGVHFTQTQDTITFSHFLD